ncbi:ATP-binding protein [Myroides odoratimimus]|uniref:hypothetical protein n=1 Tax=Myroides odoratimimus TaxID=76832 RepID=UPI002576E2C7|nr:hypothetical protein [Myroides odoratimimus]MDM1525551.1 ATP-binding protein [Myroides odoratimimus]
MTKKLVIKNIGPIKAVDFKINKVNVFMGRQSSGKSTIAKILSFCNWVEKDISIHQTFEKYVSEETYFVDKLETFHKLKGYLNSKSYIKYIGDAIDIELINNKVLVKWLDSRFEYKRTKISYIPSERSMVILPEMEKLELPNNYLKSYLYDWLDTRKFYTSENKFELLDIGARYYFSLENKESHISSDSYDILLSQASSGVQSVTPLLTMVHNLIINIYEQDNSSSYELDEIKAKVTQLIISEFVIKPYYNEDYVEEERKIKIKELNDKIADKDETVLKLFQNYLTIRNNIFKTQRTNLIIEEPEQNLFPSTQKKLCYRLLEYLKTDLDHSLTITTHSPYILYALNNCILSKIVEDKIPEKLKNRASCIQSSIRPQEISVYEIKEGELVNIQQENGLIGNNFFDHQMKEVMDDFYLLLNFLD